MEIKINFQNILHEVDPRRFPKNTVVILNVDDNTTITELIEAASPMLTFLITMI